MLNDLSFQAANNNKLFVELLLNFYLDADTAERQKIEQILLENKNQNSGYLVVESLRKIAASKGL
ncbi:MULTISPECIES: hypothetical protein [unclassified Nostoc]|uniref:hypothetical protein n=1 Tax=unclassified Nostoc TaxID=2593658 RepID=UPI002AD3B631|nr:MULTISPECIES: hypothetical protein [unclassified Nostoc]MDZ8126624.1 hypothetical protein [Nostoc sp. CmiVER01]MDZ8227849.1 hypothetical protein [Nostoc sp. ChiVER01]